MSTELIWFGYSTKLVGMQELFLSLPTSDRKRGGVVIFGEDARLGCCFGTATETVLPGLITAWKLPPSRKVRVIAKTRPPDREARVATQKARPRAAA